MLTITDLDQYKATPVDESYPADTRTFYSPVDDVHGALKAVLLGAKSSVVVAYYGFNDPELAAIIAKHIDDPTMYVQVTLDKSQAAGVHEQQLLETYKAEYDSNSVAIGTSEHGKIMHRKMLIIDGIWVVNGSTNLGGDAENAQDNEARVVKNAMIAAEARAFLDHEHTKALTQMGAWRVR